MQVCWAGPDGARVKLRGGGLPRARNDPGPVCTCSPRRETTRAGGVLGRPGLRAGEITRWRASPARPRRFRARCTPNISLCGCVGPARTARG